MPTAELGIPAAPYCPSQITCRECLPCAGHYANSSMGKALLWYSFYGEKNGEWEGNKHA